MPTSIHRRVRAAAAGEYPPAILRLRSGWLMMGEQQTVRGYLLLLSDPVVPDLNALPPLERAQFLSDMSAAGDALLRFTGARLINYMILGNLDRALHAHIYPHYAEEDDALRTQGPWAYWPPHPQVPYDPERDRPLQDQLAAALRSIA